MHLASRERWAHCLSILGSLRISVICFCLSPIYTVLSMILLLSYFSGCAEIIPSLSIYFWMILYTVDLAMLTLLAILVIDILIDFKFPYFPNLNSMILTFMANCTYDLCFKSLCKSLIGKSTTLGSCSFRMMYDGFSSIFLWNLSLF